MIREGEAPAERQLGHRVAYLLASQDLTQCVRYEDQFPPFSGDVPAHWRALPLTA